MKRYLAVFTNPSNERTGAVIALLLAATPFVCSAKDTLQAFTTDGCSRFPDRALIGQADWCSCCVAHDLAYWRGGTSEARLNADRELKACVHRASNNEALAEAMFAGVRAGGGPHFYTPYRWGYGWAFGRPYGPLTPEEEGLASSLERNYVAMNPTLSCPSQAASVSEQRADPPNEGKAPSGLRSPAPASHLKR